MKAIPYCLILIVIGQLAYFSGTAMVPSALAASPSRKAGTAAPPDDIGSLRTASWNLLAVVTKPVAGSGLPLWRTWRQGLDVLAGRPDNKLSSTLFLDSLKEFDGLADPPPTPYILYESTYFSPDADAHVQDIHDKESTRNLLRLRRGEVSEFPPSAIVAKAFWRKIPANGKGSIGIWNWASPSMGIHDGREENWPQQCFSLMKQDGCLLASDYFHMVTVSVQNLGLFVCNVGCPPGQVEGLAPGDALVLVALHVAAKSRADWFWTTFWWKGVGRRDGQSWTCDNAQRPKEIADSIPWKYYSMDVTVSFKNPKPAVAASDAGCGIPPRLKNDAQLLATFNPFVEARLSSGRSTTCIDCHARARTESGIPRNYVPVIGSTDDYPGLKDFEGHIRTDYLWSLTRLLESTPLVDPKH